jgi:hypothetical protein
MSWNEFHWCWFRVWEEESERIKLEQDWSSDVVSYLIFNSFLEAFGTDDACFGWGFGMEP